MMSRAFPSFRSSSGRCPATASLSDRSQAGISEPLIDSFRMVQKLFKIPQLARAPGYSGPLPVLHGSQTDTERVSQLRLGQSEVFTQLPGATSGRRAAVSLTGRSRMAQYGGRGGFCLKHDARMIGTRLADESTELRRLRRSKAICIIDHHIGTGGLQSPQKHAETMIVSVGQEHEQG